jgi:hypothetical protein
MKKSRLIWLSAHPGRDRDWLEAKRDEGFEVHHLDGNRNNNDPTNLILIDGEDHRRLHGIDYSVGYFGWRTRQRSGIASAKADGRYKGRPEDVQRNAGIAQMLEKRMSWTAIQKATGCSRAHVAKIARRHRAAESAE